MQARNIMFRLFFLTSLEHEKDHFCMFFLTQIVEEFKIPIWQKKKDFQHNAKIYSNDIAMSFKLEKCSRMTTTRGKEVRTEGNKLPEGNNSDIEDSYK